MVCNGCAQVQDGFAETASEERWTDRDAYMAARGFVDEDVWLVAYNLPSMPGETVTGSGAKGPHVG
jgi:hypothetical protein